MAYVRRFILELVLDGDSISPRSTNFMNVKAKNDVYIEELTRDPLYKISCNGEILTRVAPSGKIYVDENVWRPLSLHIDRGGYRRIKYHYKKLQVHRIVYRQFVGPLDATLEVNHKD